MTGRRRRLRIDSPDLNLVPLLDMVSLLIQMLLVEAQFGVYAEVESTVAGGAEEATGEQLGLVIRVLPEGYLAQWMDEGAAVERSLPCAVSPCATAEAWDRDGLRALLVEIEGGHPDEQSAVLVPSPGVPFEAVVRTMDAARGADGTLFPDLVVSP